ncbi:GNAT family N-acetyltransferase [SAR202 cluster bacterium AC-409-J13_OGT_754m]|nr:GNAT family N-acetyltransferase [SAR202 cluster bacterium AC-409-J13_OGT_754m]
MVIRTAHSDECEVLVEFQQAMAQETEGKTLDANLLRQGINAVFKCPSKGFYIVAEIQGKVVGSLLITYEWSDWRNSNIWWIQSVFVSSTWRRRGVYKALYSHIYQQASTDDKIGGIRLYVDRDNHIAQQTYSNLGMTKSHYEMYEIDFLL